MNVRDVTPEEKDREIEMILSRGLVKPKPAYKVFGELLHGLGLRIIFWDTAQTLLIAAMSLLGLALLTAVIPGERVFTYTFTLAPLLYLATLLSTESVERTGNLYELKHTCKYTIRQITALRIVCFSLVGIVFCVVMTTYLARGDLQILRLLPLALSGLFLCALFSLLLARRMTHPLAHVWAGLIWMAATLTPVMLLGENWETALSQLPLFLTTGVALISGALFTREIKKLLLDKEDLTYAYGQSRY
jgi:hypothetical protein